jgi:glycosyltransferase involved in cell wall biosynthesis
MVGVEYNDIYVRLLKEQNYPFLHMVGMTSLLERPKWLALADAVVLPQPVSAVSAGQIPAKLFDAMAMAKPIIATDVSDTAQILEGCGYVVEPGSVSQLADTIKYVLQNPVEAAQLGQLARQKCIHHFSWDKMEQVLLEVFSDYE